MAAKKNTSSSSATEMWGWVLVVMIVAVFLGSWALTLKQRRERYLAYQMMSKPAVVDFFACGDYCPGPKQKYTVKVYSGVKDQQSCLRWRGEWKYFVGWGTTYYCQVD